MGVVLGLLFGIIFMIVGIILLLNPKNYSKKGLLREINEILEQANKEFIGQKRKKYMKNKNRVSSIGNGKLWLDTKV